MKFTMLLILVVAVVLAGCSVNPYQRSSSRPTTAPAQASGELQRRNAGEVQQQQGTATPATDSELPVIASLVAEADSAMQQGDMLAASDAVEQALRIEPRNARLWYRLASIRLAQQQWGQVEEMSKKSISLARGDSLLLQRNWRLIAIARQQNGDLAGSRQATEKAESY